MIWLSLAASLAVAAPEMIPLDIFEAKSQVAPQEGATAIEIPFRDGGALKLAEEAGHPVLLTFWASWCGPCRAELPALDKWSADHPDVNVVAVNVDRERAPAERFLAAVHFDLPVGFDPDAKQLGRYGVVSMPTMFLFDGNGGLAWQHTGYSTQRGFTELDAALEAL